MAEISREEAIKALNTIALASMFARECKPVSLGMTFDEIYEYLKKAISDMEKMQKIEEILSKNAKKYCGSCSNYGETCYGDSEEIEKCKYVDIEQIVKEVG